MLSGLNEHLTDMQDGETPGQLSQKVMRNIVSASYRFPVDVSLSPECLDFISHVLIASPAARMDAEGMLQHPWLAGKVVSVQAELKESSQSVNDIHNALGRNFYRQNTVK